jgi:hypothetical protein
MRGLFDSGLSFNGLRQQSIAFEWLAPTFSYKPPPSDRRRSGIGVAA